MTIEKCPRYGHQLTNPCGLRQCRHFALLPDNMNCTADVKLPTEQVAELLGIPHDSVIDSLESATRKLRREALTRQFREENPPVFQRIGCGRLCGLSGSQKCGACELWLPLWLAELERLLGNRAKTILLYVGQHFELDPLCQMLEINGLEWFAQYRLHVGVPHKDERSWGFGSLRRKPQRFGSGVRIRAKSPEVSSLARKTRLLVGKLAS